MPKFFYVMCKALSGELSYTWTDLVKCLVWDINIFNLINHSGLGCCTMVVACYSEHKSLVNISANLG